MAEWVYVAKPAELMPGERKIVDVDGAQIVVFNLDGAYYAIENVCSHDGGVLTGGGVDDGEIICPRHGARFCIKTGEALTPPAFEPIATFPIRVEGNVIEVKDDRWD
jgi:3-phenylpropionate/trans-cinnamate dioxygenase ferredoxin subunit